MKYDHCKSQYFHQDNYWKGMKAFFLLWLFQADDNSKGLSVKFHLKSLDQKISQYFYCMYWCSTRAVKTVMDISEIFFSLNHSFISPFVHLTPVIKQVFSCLVSNILVQFVLTVTTDIWNSVNTMNVFLSLHSPLTEFNPICCFVLLSYLHIHSTFFFHFPTLFPPLTIPPFMHRYLPSLLAFIPGSSLSFFRPPVLEALTFD